MDLRGKLALTEENPANIKWLLVKAGALGAINTFTENPGLAGRPPVDQRLGRRRMGVYQEEHSAAVILHHAATGGLAARPARARAGSR